MDTLGLDLGDVLKLAFTMEKTGAEFYCHAAHFTNNPTQHLMLLGLAGMESEHAVWIGSLQEQLLGPTPKATVSTADQVVSEFLDSWVKGKVFDPRPVEVEKLAKSEGLSGVFRYALGMEKDTIVFYSGLRSFLGSADAEGFIDKIIREEQRHLAEIGRALEDVDGSAVKSS
ncbi:MAG: ferritin family protein [Deltaproteobacteria bacterium]|nr:ferritin family protein [Deltaproteobacteria bacterium]